MDNLSHSISYSKSSGGFLKSLFASKRLKTIQQEIIEKQSYLEEIENIKRDLQNVQRLFNYASDPDLIEYAIYEEFAIKMRYSYLLKKGKENNIKSSNYISL